jgi:hypothetical protein
VKDNQNDELNKKVTKVKAKAVDKDLLNSTTRTKTKPDVASDELIAKVTAISYFCSYIIRR